MATEKINFNLRITEELNNELIKIANEEGRSKNSQIEYILKEFVKKYNNRKTETTEENITQQLNNIANVTINKK